MMEKKALLIINVGTPAQPNKKEVRKYLTSFLNDKRVIDIPWIFRKILVNGIIIPFRVEKSTTLYQRLWTDRGSPLLIYLNNLKQKLQLVLNDEFSVYAAMRYGQPSLADVLLQMQNDGMDLITVLPLFPQYASATTGSAVEKVKEELLKWPTLKIKVIQQFYNHPVFIKTTILCNDSARIRSSVRPRCGGGRSCRLIPQI
jgi:ferrochelatase